jgi:hypothetical protein
MHYSKDDQKKQYEETSKNLKKKKTNLIGHLNKLIFLNITEIGRTKIKIIKKSK